MWLLGFKQFGLPDTFSRYLPPRHPRQGQDWGRHSPGVAARYAGVNSDTPMRRVAGHEARVPFTGRLSRLAGLPTTLLRDALACGSAEAAGIRNPRRRPSGTLTFWSRSCHLVLEPSAGCACCRAWHWQAG
ncbi:hypothetical protein, partial [Ideonella azotifigens]|uniref:hypothetical protein n=1 Tax=Ideonella azotifigens TaxID=513160 RepID=UPI001B8687E6